MNLSRLNRKFLVLLLMTAGFYLGGVGLAQMWLGLPQPTLASASSPVGDRGPIGLVFAQAMQRQSVEQRFKVNPEVKGRIEWGGNTTLWFFPEVALKTGESYEVSLAAGSLGADGREMRQDGKWQVNIRAPAIIYQSPTGETADLWIRPLSLAEPTQLTVGRNVYDYGVSIDGNQIAYSAANDQKGYDLWVMGREGKNKRIVVECGAGRCVHPAWSPDGEEIAYSRYDTVESQLLNDAINSHSQNNTNNNNSRTIQLSEARIWTVNIESGRTFPLYSDLRITGSNPTWSPDGKWLAFIDSGVGGIRIVNLDSRAEQLFPANTPVIGGWSQDGSKLFFGDLDVNDLPSFGAAYQIEVPSFKESGLFERGPDQTDYGMPAMSPDGEWVAAGVRIVQGFSSRQLWLLSPDGAKQKVITNDQVITHGAYSWSPDGSSLLYQQVALDSSSAKPEVMTWDSGSGAMTLIARDATHPQWLP